MHARLAARTGKVLCWLSANLVCLLIQYVCTCAHTCPIRSRLCGRPFQAWQSSERLAFRPSIVLSMRTGGAAVTPRGKAGSSARRRSSQACPTSVGCSVSPTLAVHHFLELGSVRTNISQNGSKNGRRMRDSECLIQERMRVGGGTRQGRIRATSQNARRGPRTGRLPRAGSARLQ